MKDEIMGFVESFLRPRVQADGGEVVAAGFDSGELRLVLMGECAVCTCACGVRDWIAAQVRARFGEQVRVVFTAKKRYFQDS